VFLLWCAERSIARPQDLALRILERYQRWLYHYRKTNGAPLRLGHRTSMDFHPAASPRTAPDAAAAKPFDRRCS
jgi:hypothetical protein